jgi:hypothetical protein
MRVNEMKTIGKRLIYTKWVETGAPTTKKVKVKDSEENPYTIEVPIPASYQRAECVVTDKITEKREASSKTKISYEITLNHPKKKKSSVFVIDEDSPMWQDMEISE